MLAPMSLASPARAYRLALITTLASVIGGLFGYLIGSFAFETIEPMLRESRYWASYLAATEWFKWGVWAIFVAGFSPIPHKVFTIAAGTRFRCPCCPLRWLRSSAGAPVSSWSRR